MRIREAREVFYKIVSSGQAKYIEGFINPVSEPIGEPAYRNIFVVNPMESGEISAVMVSEEDMEKVLKAKEVCINNKGIVMARMEKENKRVLSGIISGEPSQNVLHKNLNPLDLRRENLYVLGSLQKNGTEEGFWNMKFGGSTRALVSLCIRDNPKQSWKKLVKTIAEMKQCSEDEANMKLKEFQERGMLGYHNKAGVWEAWNKKLKTIKQRRTKNENYHEEAGRKTGSNRNRE